MPRKPTCRVKSLTAPGPGHSALSRREQSRYFPENSSKHKNSAILSTPLFPFPNPKETDMLLWPQQERRQFGHFHIRITFAFSRQPSAILCTAILQTCSCFSSLEPSFPAASQSSGLTLPCYQLPTSQALLTAPAVLASRLKHQAPWNFGTASAEASVSPWQFPGSFTKA